MIINCTKKLQDELKIQPELVNVEDPLFSWHANILSVNRRKTLVLVNDANRYVVILHGLKAKDFKNIDSLILSSIKETLLAEYVKPDVTDNYINDGGQVVFSKTQNRTLVARMNKGCEAAEIFFDKYNIDVITQPDVSKKANSWTYIHDDKDVFHPYEIFYKELEKRYGEPIFSTKALTLKIKLDLERFEIWRRVIVPLNKNFEHLHEVIRTTFDWGYYHLHDFVIFENAKPLVKIVSEEDEYDEFHRDELIRFEHKTKISEYLPRYKQIKYVYDFGDNWEHIIDIENVLFDYDKNFAVCIDGIGDRPPEDVGGEGGYEEFLEIMSNPKHEDYKHMKSWFDSQYYRGFNIDLVNRRLRYLK